MNLYVNNQSEENDDTLDNARNISDVGNRVQKRLNKKSNNLNKDKPPQGQGTAPVPPKQSSGMSASGGTQTASAGTAANSTTSAAAGGSSTTVSVTAGSAGGAAAGSSSASAGAAAGTAGGGAAAAAPIIALIIVIAIIIIFFCTIFYYITPENTEEVASQYRKNTSESVVTSISDFFKNIFGISDNIEQIEADESLYDKNNEYDVGLIQNYNIINTAINNAYLYYVTEQVYDYCDLNGYSYKETMNQINQKYPGGWAYIYADLNYGELINILALGYKTNAYGSNVERGNLNALYHYLIRKDNMDLFFNIQYPDSPATSENKDQAADITIYPLSLKHLFQKLNIDKDAIYMDSITNYDMLQLMQSQNIAICENASGEYRTIYYTLGLDNPGATWDYGFNSDTITDIFTDFDGVPVVGDNPTIVWAYLKAAGFTDEGAAAVMGNLMVENGFRTTMSGEGGSVGLAQWTNGRKTALERYAAQHNLSVIDIRAQAGYLIQELSSPRYDNIRTSTNFVAATDLTAYYYEACSRYSSKEAYNSGKYAGIIEWSRYAWSETMHTYIIDLTKRRTFAEFYFSKYAGSIQK